jgi:hypothetical protein
MHSKLVNMYHHRLMQKAVEQEIMHEAIESKAK